MSDLWEIMAKHPAPKKEQQDSSVKKYNFDSMGYALPDIDDQVAMSALRIVTSQNPVYTKVRPLGEPYMCHENAPKFAKHFGGQAVRGYRIELSVNETLEVMDHSVIRAGDDYFDVTPYYGTTKSMFVGADHDLPEFSETSFNPMIPQYGVRRVLGKPNFFIPLTQHGQRTLIQRISEVGKKVMEGSLWQEGILDRHNIIVVRF